MDLKTNKFFFGGLATLVLFCLFFLFFFGVLRVQARGRSLQEKGSAVALNKVNELGVQSLLESDLIATHLGRLPIEELIQGSAIDGLSSGELRDLNAQATAGGERLLADLLQIEESASPKAEVLDIKLLDV